MKLRATLAVLLSCAALLAVVPAAVADEDDVSIDQRRSVVSIHVVSIHQETSERGLRGCRHSGFPIQICRPGSYKLTSNLIVSAPDTDAIQSSADNVTLDLNGFTISGPWSPGSSHPFGTGVYSPKSNITLRNGKLTGFPQGIFLTGSAEFVEGVTVTDNDYGIDSWGDSTFVDRVNARNNTYGIVLYGSGMVTNSLVTQNTLGIYIGGRGGYGGNTTISNRSTDVLGGTSMGTNVCTSGKC